MLTAFDISEVVVDSVNHTAIEKKNSARSVGNKGEMMGKEAGGWAKEAGG